MRAPTTDASRSLELSFDRGTLLVTGPSAEDLGPTLPGVVWDPRVGAFRAPAFRYAELTVALGESGVEVHDRVAAERAARPPPSQAGTLSEPRLRPYQLLARTLRREPEAIEVGGRLVFPDFALCHRRHPSRSWLLEIVGFWTPEYLTRKLAALRAIAGGRFIVCADAKLGVGREHHVPGEVIAYRRRIDVREVIRLIEG
ncbi:MAG: DUF790 family protein [Polyangiaceae bacterium]|nr:DUF790 family protein [Polyangiaceae bacterium]